MKTTLKPMADRILVEAEGAATRTPGGLWIPDNVQEKPKRGTVIAVGPEVNSVKTNGELIVGTNPQPLQAGDKVLYGKYSGTEVEVGGQQLLIMRASDVYAIIVEEPEA